MPRAKRHLFSDYCFHVINRAGDGRFIFDDDDDARRFEETLAEAVTRYPDARLLAYCIMADHWHIICHPATNEALPRFMHWLTVTHTQRYHAAQGSSGDGHLYQGRFRSFPIQQDKHLLKVMRYVERNPVREGFVEKSAEWRWSSAWRGATMMERNALPDLAEPPVTRPRNWRRFVDREMAKGEEEQLKRIRKSVNRGTPYGSDAWMLETAEKLELMSSMRPRGRPRKISPA